MVSVGVGNALYCMALDESSPARSGSGPGGDVVAVGCRQCDIQRWDVESRQLLSSYLGHSKEVKWKTISTSFRSHKSILHGRNFVCILSVVVCQYGFVCM